MSSFANLLTVLHEDNHVVGIDKPSGWPSAHFEGDEQTIDQLVKAYLKEKYQKPGNVFLGVVHRLDKPVSGCLLFARTSKAAARLSEQFRAGAVEKVYWAVIEDPASGTRPEIARHPDGCRSRDSDSERHPSGNRSRDCSRDGDSDSERHPSGCRAVSSDCRAMWPDAGSLEDWLLHDDAARRVSVVPANTPGAKLARLVFQVRARHAGRVWLELRPYTGRKHQLRVQLASRGYPIYGDVKYGSPHAFGNAIALHARTLTFLHPTRCEPMTLTSEVPRHWRGRFAELLRGSPS